MLVKMWMWETHIICNSLSAYIYDNHFSHCSTWLTKPRWKRRVLEIQLCEWTHNQKKLPKIFLSVFSMVNVEHISLKICMVNSGAVFWLAEGNIFPRFSESILADSFVPRHSPSLWLVPSPCLFHRRAQGRGPWLYLSYDQIGLQTPGYL